MPHSVSGCRERPRRPYKKHPFYGKFRDKYRASVSCGALSWNAFFEWAKQNGYLLTEDSERYDASIESVLNYPQISGEKMDQCYKIFLKRSAEKRFYNI